MIKTNGRRYAAAAATLLAFWGVGGGVALFGVGEALADDPTIDNGDGTYSYVAALSYNGPQVKTRGALQLQLVGPAVYEWEPDPGEEPPIYDDGGIHQPMDPIEGLLGGIINDEDDLAWEIVGVDQQILDELVAAYDAELAADEGEGGNLVVPGTWSVSDFWDPQNGIEEEPGMMEEMSYSNFTCWGSAPEKALKHVWNSTANEVKFTSSGWGTYTTLPLVTVESPMGMCSGVVFDSDRRYVLTAAHCVHKTSTVDRRLVDVCPADRNSATCHEGVVSVQPYSSYTRSRLGKFDFAVIKLSSSIGSSGAGYMGLSKAPDSRINSMSHTLGGYPAIGKGDESSCSVENMNLHHSRNGVIDNVATRSLRVDLTHGEGYSGGPYFYDGLTAGGRQYVYGVHAGSYWNNIVFNRAAKGPKVPYYYDAILALR